jgi:hypothetical protein
MGAETGILLARADGEHQIDAALMASTALEAVDLNSRGKLRVPNPLTEAAAAHADSRAGHTRGRRVPLVEQDSYRRAA